MSNTQMARIEGAALPEAARDIVILVPVFNDWEAFRLLIPRLCRALGPLVERAHVLAVDDGSTDPPPTRIDANDQSIALPVDVLSLRRNVGHQRAIAIGLSYIVANLCCRAVLVMDADGEDDPEAVPCLYERLQSECYSKVVFAARTKRVEGPLFRFLYWLYRFIHHILTGIPVRVGNFSVLPCTLLSRLVVASELWNHYAATVFKARLPIAMVPIARRHRLAGQSKMNFVTLITHGLSAMSVFADRIGVRLLVVTAVASAVLLATLLSIVGIKFTTSLAIPGWATYTAGILLVALLQISILALVFVFITLGGRGNATFLPIRDYVHFVSDVRPLHRSHGRLSISRH